ncbi:MAG: transposase [Chloroflexota bacterium]
MVDYDYSQAGAYFLTICIKDRLPLLGEIRDNALQLNAAGLMISLWWTEISNKYSNIMLDLHVVMPNHFHGIVVIEHHGLPPEPSAPTISAVIGWFKTMTTNAYIRGVKESGWEPFNKSLWQRSFHDHTIRDEKSLNTIREYVANNPARWLDDTLNPASAKS